uniref:Uncharacterized protein n=1 Tax=Cannabis sativa TaxID=3483 RepID=A0A803R8Y6_CANSA
MLVLMFEPRYSFPVDFARINSCIFLVLVSFWLFCGFETSAYFHLHGSLCTAEGLVHVVFL